MKGKKLNKEEIDLLHLQGLIADIRNKLGSPVSFIDIYLATFSKDKETKKAAKNFLKMSGEKMAKSAKDRIDHITAILEYVAQQKDKEVVKLVRGIR